MECRRYTALQSCLTGAPVTHKLVAFPNSEA